MVVLVRCKSRKRLVVRREERGRSARLSAVGNGRAEFNCESEGSFVFQTMTAPEVLMDTAETPEMTGAVVSGAARVPMVSSRETARFACGRRGT